MRSMFLGLTLFALTFTTSAQAAPVCFSDARSWEAVKGQLPAFMQQGSFYAVHESTMLLGGFAVEQAGANFHLEGHGRHVLAGTFHDSDTVKNVCVDGSTIQVDLVKGGGHSITQVSGGLKIRGYKFTFTSKAGYESVVARVPRFLPEMSSEDFLSYIEAR